MIITFRSNGKLTTINRVYPKALEVVGEFGGLISLLMSILGVLYLLVYFNKPSAEVKEAILGKEWLESK